MSRQSIVEPTALGDTPLPGRTLKPTPTLPLPAAGSTYTLPPPRPRPTTPVPTTPTKPTDEATTAAGTE